jgi:DNA repair protein RecN (Recombination protein N)
MRQLGMPGGQFEVRVRHDAAGEFSPHGLDRIEFAVTANPGQPAAAMAKVASGGELSRIALAIQVVATGGTHVPCLVFDEIDAGVGGGVAEIVGRRLRELGDARQVLCVTHLPQVASQGHRHVRVSKLTDGKTTRTTLTRLTEDETVEELARMLGGVEITATSRDHAREMLERARAAE